MTHPADVHDIRAAARHNAEEHLATRGLSLEDLVRFAPEVAADETLVLVASIPEGLATPESDIDIILIGRGNPSGDLVVREQTFWNTVERIDERHEVNVELRDPDALVVIADRMARTADAIEDVSRARTDGGLTLDVVRNDELRMLHRLRFGVPLVNEPVFDRWVDRLQLARLPLYATALGLFGHFVMREDTIAQIGHSETTALRMLQLAIDELATAVLASHGQTNPLPKWRVRLLEHLVDDLGQDVVERLLDLLFMDRRAAPPRQLVREGIAFADELIGDIFTRYPQIAVALVELDKVFDMPKQLT